jgi:aspartate racemase
MDNDFDRWSSAREAIAMKTIGLIGGMSWESSALYYRLINQETKRRLGGHHNAPSVMVTVDFAEVEELQRAGDWEAMGQQLARAALQLESAGAEFIVLCTNTMHKVASSITNAVDIPLLHIVDATAASIHAAGHRRVGLLATRFTMEEPFYRERMRDCFRIEVLVPSSDSRAVLHDIIYGELCHGIIRPESREKVRQIIHELADAGAESVILGCTEIELLISAADSGLPVHPSTTLHAVAAVTEAL